LSGVHRRRRALPSREAREVLADWLMLFGAVTLLVALFLPWSHQHATFSAYAPSPTAWQVFSVVDVLLALLVAGLLAVALLGGRAARLIVLAGAAIAVAFTFHALGTPPSNGAAAGTPTSGAGETVALAALGTAIAGLALSFTTEPILG
jgi:hypothetical protein